MRAIESTMDDFIAGKRAMVNALSGGCLRSRCRRTSTQIIQKRRPRRDADCFSTPDDDEAGRSARCRCADTQCRAVNSGSGTGNMAAQGRSGKRRASGPCPRYKQAAIRLGLAIRACGHLAHGCIQVKGPKGVARRFDTPLILGLSRDGTVAI